VIEPRAITWQLPVALGVLVVLDQLVALGALGAIPRSAAPIGPRVMAGLITVVVLSAVLALARWTWLRTAFAQRHPSVGLVSVALAVQIGLVLSRRGLIAQGVLERQAGLAADEFVFLTATTMVVLLVLGPLRRHRDLTADLTTSRARLAASHAASASGLADERARLAARVRELLEQRLGPTSMRSALFTPERLNSVADEVLRPLAHQLADTTSDVGTAVLHGRRARLSTALQQLRPMPVLRPGLLAATMGLLVFRFSITPPPEELLDQIEQLDATGMIADAGVGSPDLVITVEWASLIESLSLHAATVLLVLLGARRLARWIAERGQHSEDRQHSGSEPRSELTDGRAADGPVLRAWTVTILTLTALGMASLTLLRIVFGLPGFVGLPPITVGVAIGFTAPLLLITIVLSIRPAVEDALADSRTQLARANEELASAVARANALLDHERRLFARHLHASVQAAVNAASLTIERATVDGVVDVDVVDRAGASIDAAVERLRDRPSTSEHGGVDGAQDLDARLAAIVATWETLADIDLRLDQATRDRIANDAVARATLCDLIAEACANAVIHGRATRVVVHVSLHATDEEGALSLSVIDDGTASSPQRRDGLGSRILTTSCTAWELEHREGGTTLTATLPVR